MRLSGNGRSGNTRGSDAGSVRPCTGWGASPAAIPTCSSCGSRACGRRLECRSRMRRESHVRFWEGGGVQVPSATRLVIGIIGSKAEACEVMARVQAFLGERLNLAVSAEKSGVSAASRGLRFLGFHVCAFTLRSPGVMARREGPNGRSWRVRQRPTEGNIKLWVPRERVYAFCRRKRYGNLDTRQGRPRPQFLDSSDLEIITAFNSELRGFANCRVGGGRAFALPPSARSNGSCGFPASRF